MRDAEENADTAENDLATGVVDMIEEVPLELRQVMVRNSRELEQLPGQRLVNVPGNKGE